MNINITVSTWLNTENTEHLTRTFIEIISILTLLVSRSGFPLRDTTSNFAEAIETMMRKQLGVDLDEQVEEEEDITDEEPPEDDDDEEEEEEDEEEDEETEEEAPVDTKDEL